MQNPERSVFSGAFFQNATQCFQSLHHRVCIDFRHGFASRLSCSRHPPADHNTTGLEETLRKMMECPFCSRVIISSSFFSDRCLLLEHSATLPFFST